MEGGVVQDNVLILTGGFGATGFDLANEELLWRLDMPTVVAPLAITPEIIAMPTGTPRGVAVFQIP